MTKIESERLAVVENNVGNIRQTVERIEEKLEKQPEKYAAKWVEKFMYFIIITLLAIGIGIIKSCTI